MAHRKPKKVQPKGRPKGNKTAHTKETVLAAVADTFGLVFLIAQRLEVTQKTVLNYAERWPEVGQAIAQKRGEMIDAAEAVLFRAVVQKGDVEAAKWLLQRLGKDRGYTERVELDHMGTAKLKIVEKVVDRGSAGD